ncbi:MAG: type I glyceraldehyde-3-phosphate dehydrogenase [Deltaproteobacteria bacterium]|nr:type I glyceraldehyde-3-phosphate dehydrogenase [Deltaproteobacteria bacterium]MBW2070516.1 type I glyceraldehyde-3-phosphate dehydrogenase [Deltaproteobacteria bacterium]
MAVKVGINGFGRIGRTAMKIAAREPGRVEVMGVNDLGTPEELAHLLRYDSSHGRFDIPVEVRDGNLVVGGKEIRCTQIPQPENLPWKELGVEVVLECTGRYRDKESCMAHLQAGARKVIISAPAKNVDATFVLGVNEEDYDPRNHTVVSNASCTTNCLAPVAKVLHDTFNIEHGLMTTIHSYTMDQRLLDTLHKDWRRARAAALSMVPTTTGAAVAVSLVIPELKGKLDGMAIRVPTPNVSLVDLVVRVSREVTVAEVNGAMEEAANGRLQGILGYNTEPLVSVDFNTSSYSSIVDAPLTNVIDGRMVKVLSWYDNEFGYANRLVDLAHYIGERL